MPTTTGIATEFITFTRASNATVTDSDGRVKWASHNLLLNSESFDAASWTKSSVTPTANSIAAPNGTTTADTLAASGANGTTLQTFTAEAISYTFGVWLKRKTGTGNIQIAADSGTYTTVTITSDWALYTVTQTPAAGSKSAGIRIVTSADEVYAWGAALYRSDLGGMQPNTSAYPMYNPTTPKNLLGFTESLTTGWTNSNTTDAIASEVNPIGLTGAVDVAATAANGTILGSLSLLASHYTFSIWLKRKTGSGTVEITVDGTTYVAAAVTGTWTRFSTTLTPTAGTKTPGIRLVTSGDAVYAWGAQLSDSASLDSYVPVYGAAVTSAAYYGPRRDFDPVTLACKGLLVEEQRANLLLRSEEFDNVNWTPNGATISANTIAAPSGVVSADTLVEDTSSGFHRVYQAVSCSINTAYTLSVFVKAAGRTQARILETTLGGAFFDLSSAIVLSTDAGVTASIQSVGNGWYRCRITATTSGAQTTFVAQVQIGLAASSTYIGTGIAALYLWGAQLELGSFATSYIPTTTAGATRSADVAQVSTAAFPYSATEGTLVVAWELGQLSGSPAAVHLTDAAESNRIRINAHLSGINRSTITAAGSLVANIDTSTAATGITKYALGVKSADYAVYRNGSAGGTSTNAGFPSGCTELRIGRDGATGNFNGHIRQITYLPRRISNAELQQRTA